MPNLLALFKPKPTLPVELSEMLLNAPAGAHALCVDPMYSSEKNSSYVGTKFWLDNDGNILLNECGQRDMTGIKKGLIKLSTAASDKFVEIDPSDRAQRRFIRVDYVR